MPPKIKDKATASKVQKPRPPTRKEKKAAKMAQPLPSPPLQRLNVLNQRLGLLPPSQQSIQLFQITISIRKQNVQGEVPVTIAEETGDACESNREAKESAAKKVNTFLERMLLEVVQQQEREQGVEQRYEEVETGVKEVEGDAEVMDSVTMGHATGAEAGAELGYAGQDEEEDLIDWDIDDL